MSSLAACGPDPAQTMDVAPAQLTASIGPEGGTLEGRAGTDFAGVRLVIPPGALTARTQVRITSVLDETPLPPQARRVGQHFRIEPVGLALAAPASLMLPVERERVSDFAQRDADVKVWSRTDGAFSLVEPSATGAGSVTIPIRQLNIAAAGVRIALASTFSCGSACILPAEAPPARINQSPCAHPSGFCLDGLNFTSSIAADSGFLLEGHVVYLPSTSDGRYRVRRIDLTPATEAEVAPTFTGTTALTSNPKPLRMAFVRRSNGVEEVWSSHGTQGTGVFRFGNQPSAQIPPLGDGQARGVVRTRNNTIVYFEDARFAVTDEAGAGGRRALPGGISGRGFPAAALAPNDGVWLSGAFNDAVGVLGLRASSSPTMLGPIPGFPDISATSSSGPSALTALDVNPQDGRVLATALTVTSVPTVAVRRSVWVGPPSGSARAVLTENTLNRVMASEGDISLGPAVWGSDNAIWIPNTASPEIFVVDANNPAAFSTIRLTSENPGTATFANRCPQFIRAMSDRSVVVVTADGSFFRIRRAPAP